MRRLGHGVSQLLICLAVVVPSHANEPMRMCHPNERNGPEKHCITDGDTLWHRGERLRLKDFDTPEPNAGNTECKEGYTALEAELADRASARLLDLLNGHEWGLEVFGPDSTGDRKEATIRIDGRDVGDILIDEELAREWPDGDLFWC